jgi:hypothetical protein
MLQELYSVLCTENLQQVSLGDDEAYKKSTLIEPRNATKKTIQP